jgi:5'-methylthioadenosine phosphorylase
MGFYIMKLLLTDLRSAVDAESVGVARSPRGRLAGLVLKLAAGFGLAGMLAMGAAASAQVVSTPPCKATIAVIGGTYLNDALLNSSYLGTRFRIQTPVGESPEIVCGKANGVDFYYVHGHGQGRWVETWAALYKMGVKEAIGGATAGGINPEMKTGDFVVPSDFIDFNISRPRGLPKSIFPAGETILPRYVPATDPLLDDILLEETRKRLAGDTTRKIHKGGVVIQAAGGRFETPAEIRFFKQIGGDMVTMNVGSEMSYARMVGINYASLVVISNPAEGLGEWKFEDLTTIYRALNKVSLDVVIAALPRIAGLAGKPRVGDALRIHPEMTSK